MELGAKQVKALRVAMRPPPRLNEPWGILRSMYLARKIIWAKQIDLDGALELYRVTALVPRPVRDEATTQ